MLILAGVTLNLVIGNNGIIKKAGEAQGAAEQGATNDQAGVEGIYEEMLGNLGEEVPPGKVAVGTKASKNSTINGEAPNAYNPIIPEGYIPINAGEANWGDGTTALTQEIVDKGLVITDSVDDTSGASNGNEWVWVPVPTPSSLYVTANPAISITGGSGKTYVSDVSTSKYTKSAIISGITRGLPNSTSCREPDVVVGDGTEYDAVDTNRAAAGFTKTIDGTTTTMTISEMAQAMVKDYDDMIKSLEKYKGFYIGRYELTKKGEKPGPTLTITNWYNLYAKCKTLSASDKVKTRMIWGLQWDAACNWIASIKDESKNPKYSITDSSKWGNYSNYNSANGYTTEETEGYETGAGSKQDTGSSEYWKANNIYDLAGNCKEWTQEALSNGARVYIGSIYYGKGSGSIVSKRYGYGPNYSDDAFCSRATLYVE